MANTLSKTSPAGVQTARLRQGGLDLQTMTYLRRRRKRRKGEAVGEGVNMLDFGIPAYGWEPGNAAGTQGGGWASDDITISRIYERVIGTARDLVQLSVPQQPAAYVDAGKRWARIAAGENMVATGLTLPDICIILLCVRVASGGVNDAADAIFALDNGGGKSLALAAGDAAGFPGDLVGTGAGLPTMTDVLAGDIADDSVQFIAAELNTVTGVVSFLQNNQIREIDLSLSGALGSFYDLTIGSSIDVDFGWMYIYSAEPSAAEYAQAATYAAGYGASIVPGEWAFRFNTLPALSGNPMVNEFLSTTDGSGVALRNAASSFSYAWRTLAGGLIAGETLFNIQLSNDELGDQVRGEVSNTVLGQAVTAITDYSAVITDTILPSDLTETVAWYDFGDETTITPASGTVTQVNDKVGTNHITSFDGTPQTGNAADDVNGLNTVNVSVGDDMAISSIVGLGDSFHMFLTAVVNDLNAPDTAATLISIRSTTNAGNVRLASGSTTNFRPRVLNQSTTLFTSGYASDVDRSAIGLWDFVADAAAETFTVYYNGVQVYQATDYGTDTNEVFGGDMDIWLGKYLGSLNPIGARYCELVVCDTPISGGNLANMRTYLTDKRGIA